MTKNSMSSFRAAEKHYLAGTHRIRRNAWPSGLFYHGEMLARDDFTAQDWMAVDKTLGVPNPPAQANPTTETPTVPANEPLTPQPHHIEEDMRKVTRSYEIHFKNSADGTPLDVISIESLSSSNAAAVPFTTQDGKKARVKAMAVGSGITLTGEVLAKVNGKPKLLSATSAPFDIVENDNMETVVDDAGNPVIDPATGQPQQAPVPSLAIVVAE